MLVFTEATTLLAFKLKADVNDYLNFLPLTRGLRFCAWQGVECNGLKNNSLIGPLPDLNGLFNLKSLFLDNNYFTGSLPPSLFSLHCIQNLDFFHNNFSGPISTAFTSLDCFHSLRLSFNSFNSSIPLFNQSLLKFFEVSDKNLSGTVPVTPTLFHFPTSSPAFR
ncbi:hypothetical protein JHK82_033691 [Glycine max]|uniref:Putative inactive receptor kinase n=1 Tax=Glycine soja TaxID=3848 RepID=A0A0B2SMM1_GLYSO|nr:hypothetical protein JHK85_034410 [Glycine max]KAG5119271.1 hypothetical protein JHK82_033691 [Glycine max]KAG5140265.1 hypothetical protein JHK84_034033 [Glycine max]KHN45709.1 Putative inactive receptor kinase [Glycine soja]